jgi:hypothetical protein
MKQGAAVSQNNLNKIPLSRKLFLVLEILTSIGIPSLK